MKPFDENVDENGNRRIKLDYDAEPEFDVISFARAVVQSQEFRGYIEHGVATNTIDVKLAMKLLDFAALPDKRKRKGEADPLTAPQDMTLEELKHMVRDMQKMVAELEAQQEPPSNSAATEQPKPGGKFH